MANRIDFTPARISKLKCPPGAEYSLYRDSGVVGLGVRVTENGYKAFIFETGLLGKTIRLTIGSVADYTVEEARKKARRLKAKVASGTDPRS